MGNLNVNGNAKERLDEMADDDDLCSGTLAQQLINREWRGRKGFKNEREVRESEANK